MVELRPRLKLIFRLGDDGAEPADCTDAMELDRSMGTPGPVKFKAEAANIDDTGLSPPSCSDLMGLPVVDRVETIECRLG